ncbi:OmpA family protein [Pseudomonas plecoglossicida]|uniref:OmpA-like domain-containing protein n=1 Tax=Pseudomonas plecoglossicida TaxID=70775 RepID=A0AAD0R1Z0_PSEDL|nr:OmpA family protein [Pseudomonas plecoglossicida]AXM98883.1 hypothetical protein DVB73_25325 [Pseudomonas plecoglossicida]EPB95252.1 flagellar motor protein [Pseudomonas plecoglossicida NB2011]QLB55029.1 OmpA family protein [Pseudomonas plecoglossicida]
MSLRAEQGERVIVKRRSKRGHAEQQSGAWKVAFADFTLAMMALFMVLWIIQPQIDEQLRTPTVEHGATVVQGGLGIFDSVSREPIDFVGLVQNPERSREPHDIEDAGQAAERYDSEAELQTLARLMSLLAERADALANVQVQVVPQGLRILIKDDERRFMFERGSAQLNPHFRALLAALATELLKVENKLIISGHTDATPYRGAGGYDNWNLSGERALSARAVLVAAGLPATGILQVSAQADQMLLRTDEPLSGANRRIELLLLTSQAEALYRQLFSERYVRYTGHAADFVEPGAPRAQKIE